MLRRVPGASRYRRQTAGSGRCPASRTMASSTWHRGSRVQSPRLAPFAVYRYRLRLTSERCASLERRRSIWVVFLVRDQRAVLVELHARRAEMVPELVPLQRYRDVDRASVLDGLGLDERDSLLVVQDVQRLPLKTDRGAVVLAVYLEPAEVQPLLLPRAVLRFDDLPHALTGAVVDVVGRPAASEVRLPQLVLEVPDHRRQMRHRGHVAVGIVGVWLDLIEPVAHGGVRQPVALLACLEKAILPVLVATRPTGAVEAVGDRGEVPDRIVFVPLDVVAQRLQVVRMCSMACERIVAVVSIRRIEIERVLSDVLASLASTRR